MIKLWVRAVGEYAVNTVLAWCDETREAVIFDPAGETDETIAEIVRQDLTPKWLVNTHGHLDHITENDVVISRFRVPLLIHELDRPMLTDPELNFSAWTGRPIRSPDADRTLGEGDVVQFGNQAFVALHVPGHTQGSLVFYAPGILIAGDTLFQGGVGRSDLPGGNEEQLYSSIRAKLYTLPENTVVYPGHGPTTTVGEEKRGNPFVRG